MSADEKFTELYVANRDRVYRFLSYRFRDVDIEGLVTETFILAWRKVKSAESVNSAWLFVTANNLALNAIKSLSQRRTIFFEDNTLDDISWSPETEDRLDAIQAFRNLPSADRDLLISLAWDDLSVKEISALLQCSIPATYVRIHRARQRLQQLFLSESRDQRDMEARR